MKAMERSAGCFANIKTPNPARVVIAESTMEDL